MHKKFKKLSIRAFLIASSMSLTLSHSMEVNIEEESELVESQQQMLSEQFIEVLIKENPKRLKGGATRNDPFWNHQKKMLEKGEYYLTGLEKLPGEIGNFTNLTVLGFAESKLLELPVDITKLVNLRKLYLGSYEGYMNSKNTVYASADDMTKMTEIIANLKSLVELEIRHSRMQIISPALWKLDQLTKLSLVGHNFETLPTDIGNLFNLKELDLRDNGALVELPKQVGTLHKLEILRLSNTALESLPKEIGDLDKLELLSLSETALKSLPQEIGYLPNIKHLFLKNVKILPRGENKNMWGAYELKMHFENRVSF